MSLVASAPRAGRRQGHAGGGSARKDVTIFSIIYQKRGEPKINASGWVDYPASREVERPLGDRENVLWELHPRSQLSALLLLLALLQGPTNPIKRFRGGLLRRSMPTGRWPPPPDLCEDALMPASIRRDREGRAAIREALCTRISMTIAKRGHTRSNHVRAGLDRVVSAGRRSDYGYYNDRRRSSDGHENRFPRAILPRCGSAEGEMGVADSPATATSGATVHNTPRNVNFWRQVTGLQRAGVVR